jgi:hypothetical protein
MDAKVTLSFDRKVIDAAKEFAEAQGISLSRLTEFLYRKITAQQSKDLESLPLADWVNLLSEGEASYKTRPRKRKTLNEAYFKQRK